MEEHKNIIIAVFSTEAGCGKTVTAINLAAGLAKEGYSVCLVDLDLQFGDVMGYLDMVSGVNLEDAHEAMQRHPDKFRVEDYLVEYSRGGISFAVLPPPAEIQDAYLIDVATTEAIIRELADFNFIILDTTAVFSALNLAMLDMATVICYLGVMDFLPAVKNYKVGYDTLIRFQYEESKISLIENRSDSEKFIRSRDVERLLGEKFYHRLPNDYPAVAKSIRLGQPLMFSSPLSPLTQSYWQLVGRYTNRYIPPKQPKAEKEPAPQLPFSWLMGIGSDWQLAGKA
ncbi:MAG: AAA family ATPase [Selenomonadaceae bacterium]|nr:AAA family ATPase [Selenomonadaceae bacterium]